MAASQHVQQGPLLAFFEYRLIQGHIAVQRPVLLPGGTFDGRDDLPVHADFREHFERGLFAGLVIPDGFEEANHPFLDDVLLLCSHQEIPGSLDFDEFFVFVQEIVLGLLVVPVLDQPDQFFIGQSIIDFPDFFLQWIPPPLVNAASLFTLYSARLFSVLPRSAAGRCRRAGYLRPPRHSSWKLVPAWECGQ